MTNTPLLSIITTSLNRRVLLEKTLASVLEQTYPHIEQLVIDAKSTDNTILLLKNCEAKFQKRGFLFSWISERDSGQGEAMNKGLQKATGEYITILNSDDFLVPGAIQDFMSQLISHPNIDLIYGNHDTLFPSGEQTTIHHRPYTLNDIINGACQIPQSSAIFKRKFINQVGGFDESLRHVAEHDLFLRIVKSGAKLLYYPRVFQVTLEHEGRKTTSSHARSWRETKKVNFRNGASCRSRFYFLYLKNVYFQWFFGFLKNHFPKIHNRIKNLFHTLSV
ncbi:MAG: glycosyltransferase [Candidatus Liptonbacteria bacterium]|nr:glycosyltransferase [Candidatus Liptonbacteria bacterium]